MTEAKTSEKLKSAQPSASVRAGSRSAGGCALAIQAAVLGLLGLVVMIVLPEVILLGLVLLGVAVASLPVVLLVLVPLLVAGFVFRRRRGRRVA